ncbi:MAG: hypothetical protein IKQ10_08640 [Oscillospiraceae bacterium]|nr:hypothetical protein [Oscillospiraceae bacterium]
MELYIPIDELDRYAEEKAGELRRAGTVPGKTAARAVRQSLQALRRARDERAARKGSDPAGRWLLGNFYLAAEAAEDAVRAFSRVKRLDAAGRAPLILRVCDALLASGDGDLDSERIEVFLAGFQRHTPLSCRELELVPAALRASLLASLAEVFASPDTGEKRCAVLFTALRRLAVTELGALLERVNQVDIILQNDPAGIYARMDELSRRDYRRRAARLARLRRITET